MKNNNVHHEHDVGYKHIFSHKETFLELLRSFTHEKWVDLITADNLELSDKSYILSDFEEEESDIVYRANINGEEIIFYMLLEFQSKVDYRMPIRLLFYMTEIWREKLKNSKKNEIKRKNFKLPSIVPIVLYNGKNKWTAKVNFKDILSGSELFGNNVLDFNYLLFDINRYSEEELYKISNLVSAVFLIDQELTEEELMQRLENMISILKSISPEQFGIFKQWLKNIVKPRVKDELQNGIEDVLEKSNQEEVNIMVSNLGKTLDNIEKKGMEKKAKETAIKAIKMGMNNDVIIELTGLTDEEINIIRKDKSN